MFLGITVAYGMRLVVLEGAGPLRALREGFGLFTERPVRSLGLAVIQIGVSLVLATVVMVPLLILALPAILAEAAGTGPGTGYLVLAILLAPFLLPFLGWSGTFGSAYWTSAYRWSRPWPEPPVPAPVLPAPLPDTPIDPGT